ncbi:MAG: type III-B CRISPR module RAMP protein Cmr4 [Armatimonadota bacterium]|nr:type III-B CRISPR module RAMP protein Cmr4 [Armatimonadota bacterium]
MSSSGILFLRAQTAIHPGAGTAVGAVDLPVQRESYTRWPTIQGSALKGVLRDACRDGLVKAERSSGNAGYTLEEANRDQALCDIFGPPDGDLYAGAMAVTDARLLAFPVRSAKGVFVWVTCAAALSRARRDLEMAGIAPPFEVPPSPGATQAVATTTCDDLWVSMGAEKKLVVEELLLDKCETGEKELDQVAGWIATAGCGYGEKPTDFCDPRKRLVLVSGDAFTHLACYATEIATRIRLDLETKTVAGGALFTQELLPAETLFYSVLLAGRPHSENPATDASGILETVARRVNEARVLQVGGDETTGKGWCWARVWRAPAAEGASR